MDLSAVAGDLLHVLDLLGSVGVASRTSIDFLAIYIGPILLFLFGAPLLRRVIHLAKTQNITSIADFIAARYGKSQPVAATVAVIAIIGSVPYIALQLKAVASSLETILGDDKANRRHSCRRRHGAGGDIGNGPCSQCCCPRQTNATEHQHGLMLVLATESIVKLVVFIARRRLRHVLDVRPGRNYTSAR